MKLKLDSLRAPLLGCAILGLGLATAACGGAPEPGSTAEEAVPQQSAQTVGQAQILPGDMLIVQSLTVQGQTAAFPTAVQTGHLEQSFSLGTGGTTGFSTGLTTGGTGGGTSYSNNIGFSSGSTCGNGGCTSWAH